MADVDTRPASLMTLATDGLACARLVRLVQHDTITGPARAAITRSVDRGHLPDVIEELLVCPWCLSMYLGAGIVAARTFFPRAWAPVARMLALSEIVGLIVEHSPS